MNDIRENLEELYLELDNFKDNSYMANSTYMIVCNICEKIFDILYNQGKDFKQIKLEEL